MAVSMADDPFDLPPPLTCPHCGAEAQSAAGLSSHVRNRHADLTDARPDDVPAPEGDGEAQEKKGWVGRLWAKREPKTATPRPKAAPKRRGGRRVSGAPILAFPFEHGGKMLEAWKPCTANIVKWEASWGAYVLDEAIAGTLPDRLFVQPLARNYQRVAMVESVVGPIALAFAMESKPELIPLLMPEMRRAIRGAAPFMLKAVAKKRVEDAEIEAAFKEAYPDIPDGKTADEMIDDLLLDAFQPLLQRQPQHQSHEEDTEDVNA